MISKLKILTIFLLICSVLPCKSEEKFEGLIASVDSEAITTYDLSQRIKLVLKSLKLEDNIKNRDSVRDRVLELLIIEKIKKIEAGKAQVIANNQEVKEFASIVYNFPIEDFEDFKLFLEEQGIDFELMDLIKDIITVPLIAHGGIGKISHIIDALNVDEIDAVCISSLLHYHSEILANADTNVQGNRSFISSGTKNRLIEPASITEIKKEINKAGYSLR